MNVLSLDRLRTLTEGGLHTACGECPWHPRFGRMAFGWTCSTHAYRQDRPNPVVSLQIVQDPGGTTPQRTGRLCFVCNSRFRTDRTARHNFDLWRAAVVGEWVADTPTSLERYRDRYLPGHFWMNCVSHGAHGGSPRRRLLWDARSHCAPVMDTYLETLRPALVVASGEHARKSLELIGFRAEEVAPPAEGPVRLRRDRPGQPPVLALATPHTSITCVSTAAAKLLVPGETADRARERARQLGVGPAVDSFLAKYPREDHATDAGMRVLLGHWLEIGREIRAAWDRVCAERETVAATTSS